MSVDNSNMILSMMSFDKNDFYFIQILKRRKDNKDMERDMVVIRNYYIDSVTDFERQLPQIKSLCDFENARAYIRINKRNYEKLALKINKRVVEYIINGTFKSLSSVFDAVAGETHSDPDKKWIVDVDNTELENLDQDLIIHLRILQKEGGRTPHINMIPSKTGLHVITRPFNLIKFKEKYPNIDIHRDNLILLYCS